jgi:L-2-hydroxyglutarate oxidase LhgO
MEDQSTVDRLRPGAGSSKAATAQRSRYDVAIIGGGIVGLATARELLMRYPRLRLVLLEKEEKLATHQTSHNSGVIHTGIYYSPGSLKARACVQGHQEMLAFCEENGIPFDRCGKLIVALDASELPRLEELYRRGMVNGVPGIEIVERDRMREIEPYVAGVRAIYSPNTGIVDYVQVAQTYARHVREQGGETLTGHEVIGISSHGPTVVLSIRHSQHGVDSHTEIQAAHVVTCAGLQSDRISTMHGGKRDVRIVPFRGDYYVLRPERRHLIRALIYPIPDPRFPFLGVHFTRRLNGEVWAGPNAVLAFAREGYRRRDLSLAELWDTLTYGGFWKLAATYWRTGLDEMYRDYVKVAYVRELQRYLPDLRRDDLVPGPSGVRAQAIGKDGHLVDDFLISRSENCIQVQNAPSPAATSSLVIGRMIADEADAAFNLQDSGHSRQ